MTERFLKAMPYIFHHEGGFNDIKGDGGGATNYGVSLRFLQSIKEDVNHDGVVNSLDIKQLTKEDAQEIYYDNFWKPMYETKLPERLAIKMFDVAVNAGTTRSNILLQRALNNLGSKLATDGVLGNITFGEVAKYDETTILNQYCKAQSAFYDAIVANDPSQKKFIVGWHNRSMFLPK